MKIYQLIRETFPDYSFYIVAQSAYESEMESERQARARAAAESGPGPRGEMQYRVRELEVAPKKRSVNKITNAQFDRLEMYVPREFWDVIWLESDDEPGPWSRVER